MTLNFHSVRVTDPRKCSEHYAEVRKEEEAMMLIFSCIPKKHAGEVRGKRPTKPQWRKYGVIQRYLVPKENVVVCDNTLCGINEHGRREIKSIERSKRKIVPLLSGSSDEWLVLQK